MTDDDVMSCTWQSPGGVLAKRDTVPWRESLLYLKNVSAIYTKFCFDDITV